jgi:hypothetical protein
MIRTGVAFSISPTSTTRAAYQSYDPELLHLMYGALDAAWGDKRQRSWDDIAARARRTAMAFQIMMAVSAGERDPEQLKLAALNATAGRTLNS